MTATQMVSFQSGDEHLEAHLALAVDLFANRNRAVCMARIMGGMLRGSPDRFGVPDLKTALGALAE
jgi:carboxymethylenebutenolidase